MATQIINVSGVASERLVLTANTTLTLNGGYDGQIFTLTVEQDSTGGWLLTATNVNNLTSPSSTPFALTAQTFSFDAASNAWNPVVASSGPITGTVTASHVPYASGANVLSNSGFSYSASSGSPTFSATSGTVTYTVGQVGSSIGFFAIDSGGAAALFGVLSGNGLIGLEDNSGNTTNMGATSRVMTDHSSSAQITDDVTAPSTKWDNGSGSTFAITPSHQTTVGAAGGASAQPATPLGYMLFKVGSTTVAVPYHLAS